MNRRRFIGWLAGTAAAVALSVLPRVYGVAASGWVGKLPGLEKRKLVSVYTVRSEGPTIKGEPAKIFSYTMDASGHISRWTGDGDGGA